MPPSDSDATIGMQLARMDRFAEALPHLERAHHAAPTDLKVLHAAANLLVLAGRGTEADARYRLSAALMPKDLGLLCGWARVSLLRGLPDCALELFERAMAIDARFANDGGWLEGILREATDADTACNLLGALADRHPLHIGLLGLHAKMLKANEHLLEAERALERLLALRQDDAWARIELGGLAAGRGDHDAARAHLRAVLASHPGNADAVWALAEMNDWRLTGAQLALVKRAIDGKPSVPVLARLHETLAKHHDRAGEFTAAWRHAGRTNALAIEAAPARQRYDTALHESRIDLLIQHYTTPQFKRLCGSGNHDPRPVFVIGLPRSGTTLLERMLASHPGIVGVGEQGFAEASWKRALMASGQSHDAFTPQAIDAATAWHLQALEQRVQRLGLSAQAERIIDKMPDNYLMAGWLSLAFPNAAIIHVQRDPRDVAISCWFAQFGGVQWINELGHIAHRIEQHRRLMRHWQATISQRLTQVRYEQLIADPERELRRVLAALGMEWHPDVVSPTNSKGYVATASRQQVREPIHARSLARWRNYTVALEPILGRLDAVARGDASDLSERSGS